MKKLIVSKLKRKKSNKAIDRIGIREIKEKFDKMIYKELNIKAG